MLVGVIALGLGGVGAAAAFTGGGGAPTRAPVSLHTATPGATAPANAAATQSSAGATTTRRAVSAGRIGFALTVTGRVSWVEIGVPGRRPVFQGLLRHGHTVRTQARPLRIVVGDAGAVRLVLHGRTHAPLGRPGEVLVFRVAR